MEQDDKTISKKKSSENEDESAFQIQFYENILKDQPDFIEALVALGDLYTKRGEHKKGLDADLRLMRLRPEDPIILYNTACSYSLLNQIDKSLTLIKSAVKCGYEDFEHMMQDGDLQNLRQDERFHQYVLTLKNKKSK